MIVSCGDQSRCSSSHRARRSRDEAPVAGGAVVGGHGGGDAELRKRRDEEIDSLRHLVEIALERQRSTLLAPTKAMTFMSRILGPQVLGEAADRRGAHAAHDQQGQSFACGHREPIAQRPDDAERIPRAPAWSIAPTPARARSREARPWSCPRSAVTSAKLNGRRSRTFRLAGVPQVRRDLVLGRQSQLRDVDLEKLPRPELREGLAPSPVNSRSILQKHSPMRRLDVTVAAKIPFSALCSCRCMVDYVQSRSS